MSFGPDRNVPEKKPTEECEKSIGDTTLEALACEINGRLYHRTRPENIHSIIDDGVIRPSEETKVVSLSSNPSHFYGGTVRLNMESNEIDTRRMCYTKTDEETSKLDEKQSQAMEEFDPEQSDLDIFSRDRYRASVGLNSDVYEQECEFMSDEPVDVEATEEVEYFIPFRGGGTVSAERAFPKFADASRGFSGGQTGLRDKIQDVKEAADRLDADFSVNSCFPYLKVAGGISPTFAKLDKENLERLANGDELKTINGKPDVLKDGDKQPPVFC